jgi:hypothetical protein
LVISCTKRGQSYASKRDFPFPPDALAHHGDETIAIRRSVTITDDTWPAELAKARHWKLAFTPSGPLVCMFNRSSAIEKRISKSFGALR